MQFRCKTAAASDLMHEEGCLKRFIVPGISFFSLLFYVLQISRILFVSDFFSGGGVLCVVF